MPSNDYVDLFTEGDIEISHLDSLDLSSIKAMMDEENQECQELERRVAEMKRQEDQVKRRQVLESLEALQAVKARKAMLKKAIAGEISLSSVQVSNSLPNTPVTSPVKLNPTSATPGGQGSHRLGELPKLLNSVLHLRQGNAAPVTGLMANRSTNADTLPSTEGFLNNPQFTGLSQNMLQAGGTYNNLQNRAPGKLAGTQAGQTSAIVSQDNGALTGANAAKSGQTRLITDNRSVHFDDSELKLQSKQVEGGNALNNGSNASNPVKTDDEDAKLKKKKSGIMSKPDESDIIQTVKFSHELLDDRHVRVNS